MPKKLAWLAMIVLAVGLLALAGCQGDSIEPVSTTGDQTTGVEEEPADEDVNPEVDGGDLGSASSADLPGGFPTDVPIPPNANIETALSDEAEAGTSYAVGITSSDTADEIFAWYKQALQEGGWELAPETVMEVEGGTGGLLARKAGTNLWLAVEDSDGGAMVSLTVGPDN